MRVRRGQGTQARGKAGAFLRHHQLVFAIRFRDRGREGGERRRTGGIWQVNEGDAVAHGLVGQRAAKAP